MIFNQWYAIYPSKKVPKNSVVGVKRMNMDLAFFRTEDGTLGCVKDQCTHRGAALSKGKVQNNCIRCPFHGLEFSEEGECQFIPALGKANTSDLSRFNVHAYTVREQHGIIYFWYGEDGKETDELPFFYDQISEEDVYSELEDFWAAHYSRCIENQLDVVHVPIVHHNTIGRGNKTLIHGPKVLWDGKVLQTSANNAVDKGQKPKDNDEAVIKDTNLNFMFPNIWLNHITDKIRVLIYFAPIDNESTMMYVRFYSKITGVRPVDAFIAWIGKYANKVVERQDRRVVITQKPTASELSIGEKLLKGDLPIIQYRRIRQKLKDAAVAKTED